MPASSRDVQLMLEGKNFEPGNDAGERTGCVDLKETERERV